jgi:hypothetical protein
MAGTPPPQQQNQQQQPQQAYGMPIEAQQQQQPQMMQQQPQPQEADVLSMLDSLLVTQQAASSPSVGGPNRGNSYANLNNSRGSPMMSSSPSFGAYNSNPNMMMNMGMPQQQQQQPIYSNAMPLSQPQPAQQQPQQAAQPAVLDELDALLQFQMNQ